MGLKGTVYFRSGDQLHRRAQERYLGSAWDVVGSRECRARREEDRG